MGSSKSPTAPAQGASLSDLAEVIHSRAWNRLQEIVQRLNILVELVDEGLTPLLPPFDGRPASAVRRLRVRLDDAALREAIQRSMQTLTSRWATLAGVRILCVPIPRERGGAAGVLLLANERPDEPEFGGQGDLERVGSWLASALELQLASSASAESSDLSRLSSLCRLLNQTIAIGSERELIRTFIEALAVWEDFDSVAYLGDLTGRFSLELSLPGSDRTLAPQFINEDPVPERVTVIRLTPTDRERLGFRETRAVVISHLPRQAPSHWLIAALGDTDSRSEERLALYVDVLGQAFSEAHAVESSRLSWAMLQHLLDAGESVTRAAHGAMTEMSEVVDATTCFAVSRADGTRVLTVGDAARVLTLPAPITQPDRLILPVEVAPPYTAAIGMCRSREHPFTPREEKLLQAAAATLSAWLIAVARRIPTASDRRIGTRSFDQIVEQHASDAAVRQNDISLIVVSPSRSAPRPDAMHEWTGQMRRRLRATDLAGQLTSGSVGILLLDTPMERALVVAQRVRESIGSSQGLGTPMAISIGVAGRSAGSMPTQSLLSEAQARAAIDGPEP
jgi:hypothetical protein